MNRLISLLFFTSLANLDVSAQLQLKKSEVFTREELLHSGFELDIQHDTILVYYADDDWLTLKFYHADNLVQNKRFSMRRLFNTETSGYQVLCAFQNGRLAILRGEQFYIGTFDTTMNLKKITRIKLDFSCDFLKKSKGSFYFGSHFSLDRDFRKTEVYRYSIQTNSVDKRQFEFDFPLASTMFPNSYFDPLYESQDDYLVANALHYSIKIYKQNVCVDSIQLVDETLFPKITATDSVTYRRLQRNHLAITDITAFNPEIRRRCAHIWSVFYLDSITILVRVSNPDTRSFYMVDHIWKKEANSWELSKVKNIEINDDSSAEVWPYFSIYNKLLKNNSTLCFIHYGKELLGFENFQPTTYFHYGNPSSSIKTVLWFFQSF